MIKETYFDLDKKEDNSINLVNLVNIITEDFFSLINFLYVNNLIQINEENMNEKTIKKFIFRIIINLKGKDIIKIRKISVFNEDRNEIKYSNFIFIENLPKPKNLFLLFRISNEESKIKKRENTIIIGFYHYSLNIRIIKKKKFKKESIISKKFIKSIENRSKIRFFPD
jgi:hypothetical protein